MPPTKILRASSMNFSGRLCLVWSLAREREICLAHAAAAEAVVVVKDLEDGLLFLKGNKGVEFLLGCLSYNS